MATPTYVGASSNGQAVTTSSGTFTVSYSGSAGSSNPYVLFYVTVYAAGTAPTSTSATYNGSAMTLLYSITGTGAATCTYVYGIPGNGNTSQNAVFSWSGAVGMSYQQGYAALYNGVNQTFGTSGNAGVQFISVNGNITQTNLNTVTATQNVSEGNVLIIAAASQYSTSNSNIGPNNPSGYATDTYSGGPGTLLVGNSGTVFSALTYNTTFNGPGNTKCTWHNGWQVTSSVCTTSFLLGLEPLSSPSLIANVQSTVYQDSSFLPLLGKSYSYVPVPVNAQIQVPEVFPPVYARGYDAVGFIQPSVYIPPNPFPASTIVPPTNKGHEAFPSIPLVLFSPGWVSNPPPFVPSVIGHRHRRVAKYQFGRRPK